jgi:glutathione S-transferase
MAAMRRTLHGLPYSPWTERARWALDHHGVAYRFREHVPMLGEPALRWAAKPPPGARASVPVLVDEHGIHRDSIDIVLHADRIGAGPRLVQDEAALRALAATAERGLDALRARVTARILGDRAALRESAQAVVPAFLAPLIAPVAAMGARFIARKYASPLERDAENLAAIRDALRALAAEVDTSSVPTRETLRAEHLVLATFLQGIRPVETLHIRLRPAVARAWTCEELAAEHGELLRWRDAVYASVRGETRG